MRKGLATLVLIVFAGLVFLTIGVLQATEVPEVIKIYDESFKDHKKGPVTFSHKKHSAEYKVACTECHHNYQDGTLLRNALPAMTRKRNRGMRTS
jgi:cytochrome c peroxidase